MMKGFADMEDTKLYQLIGRNIKFYRTQKGITQRKFCEHTGISLSYLTKLEAAHCTQSVSISLLNRIAHSLEVDIIEFFKER